MKNLKILLILGLALLSVSYSPKAEVDPQDLLFFSVYKNWFFMTEEQQSDRIRMYELSENKYLWFPSKHPRPSNIMCFDKSPVKKY